MKNLILNSIMLKAFYVPKKAKYGCLLSPLPINIIVKALAKSVRWSITRNREPKHSLLVVKKIAHVENQKEFINKPLELIKVFIKVCEYIQSIF